MSGTVIRVKRRLDEDPVDTLLLSYKRRKTTEEQQDEAQSLLTFAGTVHDKDLDVVRQVFKNAKTKQELKETFKKHVPDINSTQRKDNASRSRESRFKILSCKRAIETVAENDEQVVPITIVDVGIDDEAEGGSGEQEEKYVYDLYSSDFMPEQFDIDDGYLESLVSVEPFHSPMNYRGSEDTDEIDPYDEDSNDEGNWRNDYPDSDNSINEDDMRLAAGLHGMGIDNGVDLSSDSNDELYLEASGSSPPRGFDAYKRNFIQQQKHNNFVDVIDSDESSTSGGEGD